MGSEVDKEASGTSSGASPAKGKRRSGASTPAKPESGHDDERSHRAKERRDSFLTTLLILTAAGGAIATVILALLAFINSQRAAVASREAAVEAKREADAAEQEIAVAKSNQARQLRAYIGFVPGGIENFGDKDKQIFRLTRKNYGLTPAYSLSQTAAFQEVIKLDGNPTRPFPLSVPKLLNSETTFPGMEKVFRIVGNLDSPDDIARMKTGSDFQFVIYGAVYYADAFGEQHYTRYCYAFKGPSMTKDDADSCSSHNDSN
jgi:hypothetical protein